MWRWSLVGVCASAGVLVLAVSPASALKTRSRIFESAPFSQAGAFSHPTGVAVDQETGNVYVVNNEADEVDVFGAEGGIPAGGVPAHISGLELPSSEPEAVAVDNACWDQDPHLTGLACEAFDPSNGDVYVAESSKGAIVKFRLNTLSDAYELAETLSVGGEPNGVAVDDDGNVYVANYASEAISEFSASGAAIGAIAQTTVPYPAYVAVGTPGVVYVGSYEGGVVKLEVNSTDDIEREEALTGAEAGKAIAVDPHGNVYVNDETMISVYNTSGALSETFGSGLFGESQGIAVNGDTTDAYMPNPSSENLIVFGPSRVLPTVIAGTVSELHGTSVTLDGTVDPEETSVTACEFEYGTTTQYGQSRACSKTVPFSGDSAEPVSAGVTGLQPGTVYYFRLTATNAEGTEQSAGTFTTPPAPTIDSALVANLTATPAEVSAELTAKIDPNGVDTHYYFEWGTRTSYSTKFPVPDEDIGAGTSEVAVSTQLTGLSANTTYHWRVVATNANATTTGADHTFVYPISVGSSESCPNEAARSGASANLPNCRAYEMVTPPYTDGSYVYPLSATIAGDGSAILGNSIGGFGGVGNEEFNGKKGAIYEFTRTATGWTTSPVTPSATSSVAHAREMVVGLNGSVFSSPTAVGGEDNGEDRLFLAAADGSLSSIGPVWQPSLGGSNEGIGAYQPAGSASDPANGFLFYIENPALRWPFDSTSGGRTENESSLYEYVGTGNTTPELVGVSGQAAGSTALVSQCGTRLGDPAGLGSVYNAVSESGAMVFFTAMSGVEHASPYTTSTCEGGAKMGPPTGELYARLNESHTVWVSQPQCTRSAPVCENVSTDQYKTFAASEAAAVHFEGASADGSKVFFTTTQQLTSSDQDATNDLYEYNFDAPAGDNLTQISAGGEGDATPGSGAQVQGVSRISEDGSHVYFVAQGVLTTTPSPDAQGYNEHGEPVATGAVAQAGADNLYVYEPDPADPSRQQTAFIADLCSGPSTSGTVPDVWCPADLNTEPPHAAAEGVNDLSLWSRGDWDHERPIDATPEGRFAVFTSYGDLTPDDSATARQAFEYDAQTGALVRVSIGQDGFDDNGNATAGNARIAAPEYSGETPSYGSATGGVTTRTMSDDGSYVFFQSPVGLTSKALDDVPIDSAGDLAQNVYEYHDGQVSLISDGKDVTQKPKNREGESGVALIGTTPSGGDVFFTTADQLVPQDTDTQINIYDARIGGGFPAPSAPAPCRGEACQGALGSPLVFGAPSSATLAGAGNLAPPPSGPATETKAKPLTRVQKLTKALKSCAKKPKKKRLTCEAQARKKYGSRRTAKKSNRRGK